MPGLDRDAIERYRRDGVIVVEGLLDDVTRQRMKQVLAELIERSRGVTTHDDSTTSSLPIRRRSRGCGASRSRTSSTRCSPNSCARPRCWTCCPPCSARAAFGCTARSSISSRRSTGRRSSGTRTGRSIRTPTTTCWPSASCSTTATEENGPLLVLPGSHRGPTFDHHGPDGRFCGAMDPARDRLDFASAIPLIAPAGSCSFHHVRAVHGSAQNRSSQSRNLLLYEFTAADAFPLLGITDWDEFNARLLVGSATVVPRTVPCPIRMPYPPASEPGIDLRKPDGCSQHRYFDAPPTAPRALST